MKMIMKMLKKIMFFTSLLLLLCDCQPEVDIKELFFILNTEQIQLTFLKFLVAFGVLTF